MNFIARYFEKKKQRDRLIEEALKLKEQRDKEELDISIKMESQVPWVVLVGERYDLENTPKETIASRYRWNQAFIKKLKEDGYEGQTDEQLISDWERKTELARIDKIMKQEKEAKKKSNEPWVEIVSESYDQDNNQVSMILDWNKAFIKMLRSNGYTGSDEQQIVDKWFKRLSENIAQDIHNDNYQ